MNLKLTPGRTREEMVKPFALRNHLFSSFLVCVAWLKRSAPHVSCIMNTINTELLYQKQQHSFIPTTFKEAVFFLENISNVIKWLHHMLCYALLCLRTEMSALRRVEPERIKCT